MAGGSLATERVRGLTTGPVARDIDIGWAGARRRRKNSDGRNGTKQIEPCIFHLSTIVVGNFQ
jgi:hypothetical protein